MIVSPTWIASPTTVFAEIKLSIPLNNEFTVSLKLFSFAMVMPSWFSNVL